MKGPRRNEKPIEPRTDPRQRPLFDGWIPAVRAERETSAGDLRRVERPHDREA